MGSFGLLHNKKCMWDPFSEFQKITLPNGLDIYVAHWPNRSFETVNFLVHSGAKEDPIGLEGLAHFTEHILSKNISLSYDQIKDVFEAEGGFSDLGATSFLGTSYEFFSPIKKEAIVRAFDIFAELLLSAKIEKKIENERRIILNEFNKNFPLKIIYEEGLRENQSVFHGHWLERFVRALGSPETINKITKSDLQNFYDSYYIPQNISIVAVGGLHVEEIKNIIEGSEFGKTKKSGKRIRVEEAARNVELPKENRHLLKASEIISEKNHINSAAYESVCMLPGDIKYAGIKILKGMLNKALMKEIRENKNWTYSIGTNCHDFGNFYKFSINCGSFSPTVVDEMEKIVDGCIEKIGTDRDLFEKIKNKEIMSCDMLDLSANDLCDRASGDLRVRQKIVTYTEFFNDLQNTSLEDIQKIAGWLEPKRRRTYVLIP